MIVEALPGTGTALGLDLRIVRDDLLPLPGGGNKVRKGLRIIDEVKRQGSNAVVTTGGLQSNHARVTALLAARAHLRCSLVLHGSHAAAEPPRGNLLLMKLAGAGITICSPDEVGPGLDAAVDALEEEGYRPSLIPGGGHSLPGALAYVDAVESLRERLGSWVPEWIILASGTGATQAGLIGGCRRAGWATRVTGISVARAARSGGRAVAGMCEDLESHFDLPPGSIAGHVDFRDDWVGGGYERAGETVFRTIREVASQDGLLLDPTYTGKAFTGLVDLVSRGEIARRSRVIFWHTGGLLNLLSADPGSLMPAGPP